MSERQQFFVGIKSQRYATLFEEYVAVVNQLKTTIDADSRVRLRAKLAHTKGELDAVFDDVASRIGSKESAREILEEKVASLGGLQLLEGDHFGEPSYDFQLKDKGQYLTEAGAVRRAEFRSDLLSQARDNGVSIATVLSHFFKGDSFSEEEMGLFALNTSATGNVIDGAVVLLHALFITPEQASSKQILEKYLGVSPTDPQMWGASWRVDAAMNWPPGTTLPSSRQQLAKM